MKTIIFSVLVMLVSKFATAQTKVPKKEGKAEVKPATSQVVTQKVGSDTTLSVNITGEVIQDTLRKVFLVLGDDGSETYKPLVHAKGYQVIRYVVTKGQPQQQPILLWEKFYKLKWEVINSEDVVQALDEKKKQ